VVKAKTPAPPAQTPPPPPIFGVANITLDDLLIVADGHVSSGSNTGVANITLDPLTVSAVGQLLIQGRANIGLDPLSIVATGALLNRGSANITLGSLSIVATGAQGTLGAPTLGFPSPQATNPTAITIKLPGDWISGDILKLDRSASASITTPTTITHTLTDADAAAGSISMGLSGITLSGNTYFRSYGQRSGLDSVNKSNVVAWGDTTAPVITNTAVSGAPGQNLETQKLFDALTFTDTGGVGVPSLVSDGVQSGWYIAGGADQLQFEIAVVAGVVGIRWIGDGVQSFSAPLDQGSNNLYDVTVGAIDYSGNGTTKALQYQVTQADTTPNAFSWTFTTGAPPGTLEQSSSTWVVSGLGSGINAVTSVTGGEIRISHDQGTTWGAWGSTTTSVANGDWIQARGTSSTTSGATVNVAVTVGTFTATYQITTAGASAGLDTSVNGSVFTFSNVNKTAKNTSGTGNHAALSVASHSTGKWYWEVTCDAKVGGATAAGIAGANVSTATAPGFQAGSTVYEADGLVWHNSSDVGPSGANGKATWTTGDRLAFAADLDAGLFWAAKFVSGSPSWQTGTPGVSGGLSLSGITAPFKLLLFPSAFNDQQTLCASAADQLASPPSGFTAWA
jgi:hypothetical protein